MSLTNLHELLLDHLIEEHRAQTHLATFSLLGGDDAPHGIRKRIFRQTTRNVEILFERMVDLLAPDTILEIGAHEAGFSRRCKAKHPEAQVIAFEANPAIYGEYRAEAEAAGVTYRNECVGDADGTVTFNVPIREDGHLGRGTGSLNAPKESGRDARQFETPCHKLDSIVTPDSGRIAAWIDVEGAVGQVLDGGSEAFHQVDLAFIELEEKEEWAGQLVYADVARILAGFGLLPFLSAYQRRRQLNVFFLRQSLFDTRAAHRVRRRHAGMLRDLAGAISAESLPQDS